MSINNPITILLGAGASRPYGVPLMVEFYHEFCAHLKRRYPECLTFLKQVEQQAARDSNDLETLLSDLTAILSIDSGLKLLGATASAHSPQLQLARELRGYLDAF